MVLSLFVGIDNYNRSRLVAQALMNDETTTSFEWVLSKLLESTGYQL
ncbi:5755_t:CDS:1, partial [Gigaspora rosea]